MKKVSIFKDGIRTYGAVLKDPTNWINECISSGYWGKPDRWVRAEIDSNDIEYVPGEVLQNNIGRRVISDSLGNQYNEYRFEAEYSVVIEDITDEVVQQEIKDKVKSAIEFGQSILVEFSAENIMSGITQAGMTKSVRTTMAGVSNALMTGSLYDAIAEAKAIPSQLKDSKFVTNARLLKYVNKVEDFLGINRSQNI